MKLSQDPNYTDHSFPPNIMSLCSDRNVYKGEWDSIRWHWIKLKDIEVSNTNNK